MGPTIVKCAAPDQSLFYFEGEIQLDDKKLALALDNFLPRGATM